MPIARWEWLARPYLCLLGLIARRIDDGRVKARLVNLVRSVAWHDVSLPGQRVSVASDVSLRIVPHVGEFDFDALFCRSLEYEREVFKALRPRMSQYEVVLEIGANIGLYTTFFSKALAERRDNGHVFAFEPSQKAFVRLCENLRLNKAPNVTAFNCAIGSSTGFVPFFEPEGHLTNGSLNRGFAELFSAQINQRPVIAVDGRTVDELVPRDRRTLMKIDVEGSECEVLRSLQSFVLTRFPDVVLEVLPDQAADLDTLDFIRAGYRLFNITETGLIEKNKFEANSRFRDYLLLPNSAAHRSRSPQTITSSTR